MRSIGTASRALDMMLERVSTRKTFGKYLREHGTILADIAKSRAEIDSARLLVLSAAHQIDEVRAKGAMKDIGIAKVSLIIWFVSPWHNSLMIHPSRPTVHRPRHGSSSPRSSYAVFRCGGYIAGSASR